MSLCVK